MVNIDAFFEKKEFMQAEDIENPIEMTIEAVEEKEIGAEGEEKKRKLIMSFQNSDKALVLNRTNSESIAKLHGPETDGWKDKKIILFKSTVQTEGKFKGKPCIRVKEAASVASAPSDKAEYECEFMISEGKDWEEDIHWEN